MASPELQRLWQLSQVDQGIEQIKVRASRLDIGQRLTADLKELETEFSKVGGNAKTLRAEQTDLELKQKGIDDKIKKFEKEMYGGTVHVAKEVANLEKEIAALKRQREASDARLLELLDLVPPAEAAAKVIEDKMTEIKASILERQKLAQVEKVQLQTEFKRLIELRPKQAEAVKNPALLARYEVVRQRHAGIGMAKVTKEHTCGACGTVLPERTLEMLKDDKVVPCQACTRLLYKAEGII